MFRLTDVVKNLLIINVIVYIALNFTMLSNFYNYFVLYPLGSDMFQPVQLITSMFNHAPINPELSRGGSIGLMHIFGNMLTLCFFGPTLESHWGPKRFLLYYLICGLGADFFHLFAGGGSPVLGASGAIAGVLLAFGYYFHQFLSKQSIWWAVFYYSICMPESLTWVRALLTLHI